jgi:ABC-type Fe3+ transport system substrate-binding protein
MNIESRQRVAPVLFFALLAFCPSWAIAAALDSYIEGAKKEASVILGITLRAKSHGKPSGEKYLQTFQKRYPFLKAQLKRVGGSRERERVFAEMTAGMVNYDVTTASDTMVDPLVDAKVPMILDWKQLGVLPDLIHPRNVGISMRTAVYGIAYNREKIPESVAQSLTWESCTEAKWKGKTAMDDRPRHLNILYQNDGWGREKTIDYAKRWAANKPAVEGSRSTATEKLAAGSYQMICGIPRRQVRDLQVNADAKNIGIVYPEPIPISFGDVIYIPQKAKHPNAAVLFLAWTSTLEAQTVLDDVDFSGHPAFEGSDVNKITRGKKIVRSGWEYVNRSDAILAEIMQAMGFPVVR